MAGLVAPRNTPELAEDREYPYPVEANTNIYLGALIALNAAGNAVPMSAIVGLKVLGRAERVHDSQYPGENAINNPGAAGAISIVARRGVFLFNNSATHAITQANVGGVAFAEDDHTVANSDETATLSAAGRIVAIDISGQIWVDTRFPFAIAA